MKTIAAIALTLWLTGCGLLPATYDNNEYLLLAQLEANTVMINKSCDDNAYVESRIPDLEYDVRTLHSFTFYIPRNTDVYDIVDILQGDVLEFKEQYEKGKGNKTYCTIKTKIFLEKIRETMEAVANKVRE